MPGFWVNEGPAVMVHGDKLFISYSASATDENYCMGLLWIDLNADPLNPQNWHKSPRPVFTTSYENRQYGPGHNSFTQTPEGEDVLVYHARNYTEIEGDPLYDPNRHTRLKLWCAGTKTRCQILASHLLIRFERLARKHKVTGPIFSSTDKRSAIHQ